MEGGRKMIVIFLIVFVVVLAIVLGCFRKKIGLEFIPIAFLSSVISSAITLIICAVMVYRCPRTIEMDEKYYTATLSSKKPGKIIKEGDDLWIKDVDSIRLDSTTLVKIITPLEKSTFRGSLIPLEIFKTSRRKVILMLGPKDYETLKNYVEEGKVVLEKNDGSKIKM